MEKQKYLYKNSKCVAGTSSTVSLINAWISMTGQRNIQKYRSIAYLGGFTILALATIWFISQSQTYTIKYDSKEKSKKPDKQNKKKGAGIGKSDKRSNNANKNSIGWWSSFREKIANKLGFGKKSKSQKNATKVGKLSGSRNANLNKIGKSAGKKRSFKDCGNTSRLPNGLSDLNNTKNDAKSPEVKKTIIGSRSENNTFNSNSSIDNVQKEGQITRDVLIEPYGDSSPSSNKYQATQKIQAESHSGDSSSDLRQKAQETRVESCGGNFISEVKQQQLRKLKLKVHEVRSSNWINRNKLPSRNHTENKRWLGDCSKSKYPEKANLTSPIHNVKCPTKPLCQDVDNKDSNHQDHLLTRIVEKIKKIRSIDLQDREKCQEFYIPYVPLTSRETFDKIGQERIEHYKKLLVKLTRQNQQDSKLESILRTVKEFFHEKKYYLPEDDGDFNEERADLFDELYNFFNQFEQNIESAEVTNKDNVNKCSTFVDVLAQVDEASRKRIERSFEILRLIDSYQQQGKETEASIKKSIEMFNKQRAQYKGMTRCLKRPSAFHDELNQLKDRLMDTEQQVKDLATSLDDMEAYLTEMLELSDDDDKMNTAVAKYGPILIDDV